MVGTNQHIDRLLPRIEAAVELKELRHQNPDLLHQRIHGFGFCYQARDVVTLRNPDSCLRIPTRFDVISTTHSWPLPHPRLPPADTYYNRECRTQVPFWLVVQVFAFGKGSATIGHRGSERTPEFNTIYLVFSDLTTAGSGKQLARVYRGCTSVLHQPFRQLAASHRPRLAVFTAASALPGDGCSSNSGSEANGEKCGPLTP
jgi:hypothetical protein